MCEIFREHPIYLKDSNLSKDMAMFNQEIGRLTKERDTAKTELEVRVHCKKVYIVTDATLTSNQDYYWTGGPGRSSGITTFSW